ncbi:MULTISPECIES: RHS repeat-associated core domain-containing protein, partial [unclassified Pseudomonas]|uniref:RHS repeat-associated core domain-containing protein n=1 Tax=unclassified Pseudomonas TaxID=196821 RepID=UPI0021144F50
QELTDYSGEIMWSAKYRAYGNLAALDVAEIDNPLRFQGQYFDAETGLHYNRHRYYNPGTGRFLTPNPIKLAGGLNNYRYVHNPTGWVDPLGQSECPGGKNNASASSRPEEKAKVKDGTPPPPVADKKFKPGEDVRHFEKHGEEIKQTLGEDNYTLEQYVADANSVIRNGTFAPELNAYVAIPGGTGSAKGLLVGVDRATGEITTMHLKSISFFENKAPSLGWKAQPKSAKTDTTGPNPQVGWKSPYGKQAE